MAIDAVDLLYMSTAFPQGEETEIEQRIRYFVRNKYNLSHDTFLKLNTSLVDSFEHSINEVFELCHHIFNALAEGHLLKPGMLSLPAEDSVAAFTQNDVDQFDVRLNAMIVAVCEAITKLGGDPVEDSDGNPICNITSFAAGITPVIP